MVEKSTIHVLLIEDNLDVAGLIRKVLSKSPTSIFDIKHETELTPALKNLSLTAPDIIVLDLSLPDSQGFQTFFSVRYAAPDVPVIILTGTDDESMAVQALRQGAQDYLVKSQIDIHSLLRAIRYAIERHNIEKDLRRIQAELEERVKERTAELTMSNQELQREIEERMNAQVQLVQAAKMEVVGRLASGVAHEVRNPLAIILQGMEYLESLVDTKNEQIASTVQSITNALTRADRIINDLLDFSRVSQFEMKPQNVNDIVETSLSLVKHHLSRNHVQANPKLASDLPQASIDKNKIEQVFVNLFINAIDAMPNGGNLSVTTRTIAEELGQKICIEIDDSGSGIQSDIIDKVFDPFFTTKRTKNGTGLGLSIVKSIIEMHKGSIRIENRSQGGVRVTVLLPQ
jgi:C4-dicarboxylate-specific signal transduction histidine kinase